MSNNFLKWSRSECVKHLRSDFPDLLHRTEKCQSLGDFLTTLIELCCEVLGYGTDKQKEAASRLLCSIQCEGSTLKDSAREQEFVSQSFRHLFDGIKNGILYANSDFYLDYYFLFKQLYGWKTNTYEQKHLQRDMNRWATGLDTHVLKVRHERRHAIIRYLITRIDTQPKQKSRYRFEQTDSSWTKMQKVVGWWQDHRFQLSMAARTPQELNAFMENSLTKKQLSILQDGVSEGMPIFITPYYASLLDINGKNFDDNTIRSYVLSSRELVNQFGRIKAWEQEDKIETGKPNAAGWILPNHHNVHRRYPEVAILIPDSMGRACGGLCTLCQRMYGFQKGALNFDLETLKPKEHFREKLRGLMDYFENDTQLRDILITGGDALMSQTPTLRIILDEIYAMALRKKQANETREEGKKYAEFQRIRLGSRLPVYLPHRITPELCTLLKEFHAKAGALGFKQFVIQTHFESPLEITPEARDAVQAIRKAGWIVTNQLVFTTAASRRGHTARLRAELNNIGVVTYYTFTVKGFEENRPMYAPNSRSMQEMMEEKKYGHLPAKKASQLTLQYLQDGKVNLDEFRNQNNMPFLSTDRNVLNLPGIGKSMTFETIGITSKGQRILRFHHDATRKHSPVVSHNPEMIIVENRSIASYLRQITDEGEDINLYHSIWSYDKGETEPRFDLYQYPEFDYKVTDRITNIAD
ncbi:MAG: KamA family radical SAM protein [Marinifilaceae bacterium]